MSGYLADTSIFVASEAGRVLVDPPRGLSRISVVTLTELGVGVRRSADDHTRQLRQLTLARARRYVALPYDELVADRLAEILASAHMRARRAGAMDAIIAATALAHDLTVWTQDDDFEVLAELAPDLRVARA